MVGLGGGYSPPVIDTKICGVYGHCARMNSFNFGHAEAIDYFI
jgi:hypothetical protein